MVTLIKFLRAIRIGFQYIYRNIELSLASIIVTTLSFFILSIIALAFYASNLLVQYIDTKPALIIFLRGDLNEDDARKFVDLVNSTGLARELLLKDINYSKEDFLMKYNDPELIELFKNESIESFLPRITFVYGYSQDDLKKLIQILEKDEYFMKNIVDTRNLDRIGWYSFNTEQANLIKETNNLIFWVGTTFTIVLIIISSTLIFITIKLSINYHRKEIEIMDLVGADGWFIRLPFVFSGSMYGIIGAFLSTTIIIAFRGIIFEQSNALIPRLFDFFEGVNWPEINNELLIKLYIVKIIIGATVGAISSFLAILKYVKKY